MPGEKNLLGAAAERAWNNRRAAGLLKPPVAHDNCDADVFLPPSTPAAPPTCRATAWIIAAVVLGEAILVAYVRLRRLLSSVEA